MCILTYAIHRGAMSTVSVPLHESPHETATWAETRESRGHGIWPRRPDRVVCTVLPDINPCLSPSWFSLPWPCSAQPLPKLEDYDDPLVNMPIKVLFVLHQKKAPSQPPGAHVRERLELTDYLGASGKLSITTGVSMLRNFCSYAFCDCSGFRAYPSIYEWSARKNIYIFHQIF